MDAEGLQLFADGGVKSDKIGLGCRAGELPSRRQRVLYTLLHLVHLLFVFFELHIPVSSDPLNIGHDALLLDGHHCRHLSSSRTDVFDRLNARRPQDLVQLGGVVQRLFQKLAGRS